MSEVLLAATPALFNLHVRGAHNFALAFERLASRSMTLADRAAGESAVVAAAFPWEALAQAQSEVRAAIKKHGADAVMTNGDEYRPETFALAELRDQLDGIDAQLAPYRKLMEPK